MRSDCCDNAGSSSVGTSADHQYQAREPLTIPSNAGRLPMNMGNTHLNSLQPYSPMVLGYQPACFCQCCVLHRQSCCLIPPTWPQPNNNDWNSCSDLPILGAKRLPPRSAPTTKHCRRNRSQPAPLPPIDLQPDFEGYRRWVETIYPLVKQGCDLGDILTRKRSKNPNGSRHFACTYPGCTKNYAKSAYLKAHYRIHTGERPYVCKFPLPQSVPLDLICQMDMQICGQSFCRTDEVTRHRRRHQNLRPFKCPFCMKSFGRSDHRKVHLRTHTKQFLDQYNLLDKKSVVYSPLLPTRSTITPDMMLHPTVVTTWAPYLSCSYTHTNQQETQSFGTDTTWSNFMHPPKNQNTSYSNHEIPPYQLQRPPEPITQYEEPAELVTTPPRMQINNLDLDQVFVSDSDTLHSVSNTAVSALLNHSIVVDENVYHPHDKHDNGDNTSTFSSLNEANFP